MQDKDKPILAIKLVTGSQSANVMKISECNFCKMLAIKSWVKWEVIYKNWTVNYSLIKNLSYWSTKTAISPELLHQI